VFNKKGVSLPTSAPAFSVTTELPPCSGRSEATPAACFSLRSGPSIFAIGPTSSSCSPSRNSLCFEKYLDHVMFVPSLSWQMIVFYRAKESEKGIRSVVCLSLHIPARRDRPAPLSRRAQRLVPGSDPPSGFPNKKFIPTVFGFLSGQMRKSLVVFVLLKTFCCVLPSSHPKAVVFKVRDLVNPA
jgi:hypothetical protein